MAQPLRAHRSIRHSRGCGAGRAANCQRPVHRRAGNGSGNRPCNPSGRLGREIRCRTGAGQVRNSRTTAIPARAARSAVAARRGGAVAFRRPHAVPAGSEARSDRRPCRSASCSARRRRQSRSPKRHRERRSARRCSADDARGWCGGCREILLRGPPPADPRLPWRIELVEQRGARNLHLDRFGELDVGEFRNVARADRKRRIVTGRARIKECRGVETRHVTLGATGLRSRGLIAQQCVDVERHQHRHRAGRHSGELLRHHAVEPCQDGRDGAVGAAGPRLRRHR